MDAVEDGAEEGVGQGVQRSGYRPTRRGSPRPSTHTHFDINEHLPWMIVLLLLLVLVVIVVCSVKRSSRVLKKGPVQDPSSIIEKAIQKKTCPPTQTKEKWIYYSNGQGVDILKLVAAQIGSQWIDIYQSLANATEREVAAFSNGYQSDHDRAYAALQHWTIRDGDANLAKLINALHRHRRIDVVEKIRGIMEENPQFDLNQLMTAVNVTPSHSPVHKTLESPRVLVEQSPVHRTKGFFPDESEPLLRCDSTSSKDSALSRTGSFITKEKKDTVLRQVRLDRCDLQPVFDDMLHILNPDELHVIEEIPIAEDKLDRLFEIAGVKSQEASQTLLDSTSTLVRGHPTSFCCQPLLPGCGYLGVASSLDPPTPPSSERLLDSGYSYLLAFESNGFASIPSSLTESPTPTMIREPPSPLLKSPSITPAMLREGDQVVPLSHHTASLGKPACLEEWQDRGARLCTPAWSSGQTDASIPPPSPLCSLNHCYCPCVNVTLKQCSLDILEL
ncbi:unnamed protein product, partial [Coregonus sp. 'balchen']